MSSPRLPLSAAYIDPAFMACLSEAINTPELVQQHDRLYGSTLMSRSSPPGADGGQGHRQGR